MDKVNGKKKHDRKAKTSKGAGKENEDTMKDDDEEPNQDIFADVV